MARTAYFYVKTVRFASDVPRELDSLSANLASSPTRSENLATLLFKDYPETKNVDLGFREFEIETPSGSIEKEFDDHLQNQVECKREFPTEFYSSSNSNSKISTSQSPRWCITPPESVQKKVHFEDLQFGIVSPSRLVNSSSIRDFNDYYNDFNNNRQSRCTRDLYSTNATGSINVKREPVTLDHQNHTLDCVKKENCTVSKDGSTKRSHFMPYDREMVHNETNFIDCKRRGQQTELFDSELLDRIKNEVPGCSENLLLETAVSCFLKTDNTEHGFPQGPSTDLFPEAMSNKCKSEDRAISSANDTGIGSSNTDEEDSSTSESSLDERGSFYVSELQGTVLRIRKLSKVAANYKTTLTFPQVGEKVMDFEASIKALQIQAKHLKRRIKLRNKRVKCSNRQLVNKTCQAMGKIS